MFGSPYILLAIVVAFGGALAWGKIESALASHYKALDATNQQTIKGQVAELDDRAAKIAKANEATAASNAKLLALDQARQRAIAQRDAERAKNANDRASSAQREAEIMNAPKPAPAQACAAACANLGEPL